MMRKKVRWARSARRDLESIVNFLVERTPQAALSTLDQLEARAKSLGTLADRGRIVPELGRLHIREYRELIVGPYRLIYRVRGSSVLVLAAVDGRRSLEDILLERLISIEGQEAE